MDRLSDKEKSSRKHRDSVHDRESIKDSKDRDHHKHHRSSKDKSRDAADDDRHHHSHRRSKHRDDDDDDDRHRSERRSSREYSVDRDKTIEPRNKDKSHDRHKREKSYEREDSVERKHSKRKERGGSEDDRERNDDGGAKRARVLEEKMEKRRFEEDMNGREKEEKKERRRFEDAGEAKERRERRRFEDKVKEEEEEEGMEVDKERIEGRFEERVAKKEPKGEFPDNGDLSIDGSVANGGAMESFEMASHTLPESHLYHIHSSATKVSSISTTNENKGVNINRSHEVPGKSSTDGTASDAGKIGGLSRDALDKAKRALKMQKELAEKLRRIPLLNKAAGATRESSPQLGPNEGRKAPFSSSGILPTPAPLESTSSVVGVGATSSASTLPAAAAASDNPPPIGLPHLTGLNHERFEAVKKAQELAAKMGFRQDPEFAPLINMFPGQMPPEVSMQPKPAKAPVLRLDALGREIDEHGNVINVPKVNNLSTLKVNINKQKKDAFQILKPELEVDPEENPHFDASMGINKNKILRPKRMTFQFVEEGKWSKDAEMIKLKSQFGEARAKELKAKQAQLAKAKAEPDINPNLIEVSERVIIKDKQKETIPEVEWWDVPLLQSGSNISDGNQPADKLKMEKITIYVEHPRPIEPPAEPTPPPPQPLKLTKKEQKKLRTQRRLAREKDKQEMIRQGLLEPPKPKVKMSNLMKVLGSEATQDPTKLEMEIRSAAAEREQAHIDRNIARKLTPSERREKKERKLFDDPDKAETIVSIYKVNYLSHPQARFKVDANAHENRLTGCAVISDGISVVVVEGCPKSIKRYGKLMLKRIDWAVVGKSEGEDEEEDNGDTSVNRCLLVWQGNVAKPSFNRFFIHECRTEAAARKIFSDAGVSHYWDLAVNFTEDQI